MEFLNAVFQKEYSDKARKLCNAQLVRDGVQVKYVELSRIRSSEKISGSVDLTKTRGLPEQRCSPARFVDALRAASAGSRWRMKWGCAGNPHARQ